MKTVSRVYDTYAQARNAVTAVETAGVPTSEVSLVANKYVSEFFNYLVDYYGGKNETGVEFLRAAD